MSNHPENFEIATLGAGCFWCSEAQFKLLNGVQSVKSGYSGGMIEHPTYEQVCTGLTGHAEVIQVTFDPSIISYTQILEAFFLAHDPTQLNRQGNDIGTQYRSAIFYHSAEQKALAEDMIQALNASQVYHSAVVTSLEPFNTFYPAEAYHDDYFALRGSTNDYCMLVVKPKIEKFKKAMALFLKN